MTPKKSSNLLTDLLQKSKNIDFNQIIEAIRNFKVEDLQNVNYKRLTYDIRKSKYTKPVFGVFSASLLFIFLLLPTFKQVNSSLKKLNQYKDEEKDLLSQEVKLKNENNKFEEIKIKMEEINSSFLKNDQLIFISKLLNEVAKKSNIEINYFSPLLQADSSKLCKTTSIQKLSKNFKSQRNKSSVTNNRKGSLQSKFFEVVFSSDYLDTIQFLKEIQLYDVTVIPYCLEVESILEVTSNITKNSDKKNNSIVIPLSQDGLPLESGKKIDPSGDNQNIGKVLTRIVLKIPSYVR